MALAQLDGTRGAPRRRHLPAALAGAVLSVVLAALVCAVPARLLMRAVALSVGHQGAFTWAGSAIVVGVFALGALPVAVVALATRGWVRAVVGVVVALLLFVPASGIASDEIGSASGLSGARWVALVVSGAAVYVCVAAVPWLTVRLVDRWSWQRR